MASVETKSEFIPINNEWATVEGVLYSPVGPQPKIALVRTHPFRPTNLMQWPCHELAARGVALLRLNNRGVNSGEYPVVVEDIALDIAAGIAELRNRGFEKIILFGHSAGSPLLAYYANLAANGNAIFKNPELIWAHPGFHNSDGNEQRVPPVDALIIQGVTMGLPSDLPRLDGSVLDEAHPDRIDPTLDMYSTANGWDPATRRAKYSAEFLDRYCRAQGARINRIVDGVLERASKVRAGGGQFPDDDLVIVPRTRANPFMADPTACPPTRGEYLDIMSGERRMMHSDPFPAPSSARNREFAGGAVQKLSVFLSQTAIRATSTMPAPTMSECGVNFHSNVTCTANSLEGVSVPLLMMFGTGDELFTYSELMFNAAKSQDKQLVYVKGAAHMLTPLAPEVGDTQNKVLDFVSNWINERF